MKKFAFKTLSVLLAAVLLAVALPVAAFAEDISPCAVIPHAHIFEEYSWVECTFYSVDEHEIIEYSAERCALCGELSNVVEVSDYREAHDDIVVSSGWTYDYVSNEHHHKIECTITTFQCCGNSTLTEPDYSTAVPEAHEIDPSVDQETETESVCVYCNGRVTW